MKSIETIVVPLMVVGGGDTPCSLELFEDDDGELFRIELRGAPGGAPVLEGEGESLFDALVSLRRVIEPLGYRLRCAGSAEKVYPSGMARSMGEGRKGYRLTLGKPGKTSDLVDIFAPMMDEAPASVDEQEAYFQRWVESLR
jgi:hypothetical protein